MAQGLIDDPRHRQGLRHPLPTVLAIATAASAQSPAGGSGHWTAAGSESCTGIRHGALLGPRPVEYLDWFKQSFLDMEEDVGETGEAGRRVIVFFRQDGCPCRNALIEEAFSREHSRE